MGVRIFNSCVVLLAVIYVCCGTINAAAISGGSHRVAAFSSAAKPEHTHVRVIRQADSDEVDSEEDDEAQSENPAQQSQNNKESREESDEEEEEDENDDDIERKRRRRRETLATEAEKIEQLEMSMKVPDVLVETDASKTPQQNGEEQATVVDTTDIATTIPAAAPVRNTSVLILIRDALKKVTTLPTEQVATNALQYFQLFEHFIQQTIEEVIGDDDDDDDEAAATTVANVAETSIKPDAIFTPEEEQANGASAEEILTEPELVTKQPEVVKPAETQMQVAHQKPVESESTVGSIKPSSGVSAAVDEAQAKPAELAVPVKIEPATNSV